MVSNSQIKTNIIESLLYSEVFSYPLSSQEIIKFNLGNELDTKNALKDLVSAKLVGQQENLFFVNEKLNKVDFRIKGNINAQRLMPKAYRKAKFINKFPFVEGVGISGSLSKGVMHDDGDFDFFIITKANRLWIARTFLVMYKKLFLFNSKKYFCVNYFIDSQNLEIEEKNIFTATEIATLIPASGKVLDDFFAANNWVQNYYPNAQHAAVKQVLSKKPFWSRSTSKILQGNFGERLDQKFFSMTLRRWRSKFDTFEDEKFQLTMKSRKYISKHHPSDFQNKVLSKYNDLVKEYKAVNKEALHQNGIEL